MTFSEHGHMEQLEQFSWHSRTAFGFWFLVFVCVCVCVCVCACVCVCVCSVCVLGGGGVFVNNNMATGWIGFDKNFKIQWMYRHNVEHCVKPLGYRIYFCILWISVYLQHYGNHEIPLLCWTWHKKQLPRLFHACRDCSTLLKLRVAVCLLATLRKNVWMDFLWNF